MQTPDRGRGIPSKMGHNYSGICIEGGKSQLGDAYYNYFGGLMRDCNQDRTNSNPAKDSPLDRLPYAVEAPFNSFSRQHDGDDTTCLDNTRVDVLQEIYNWADGEDKRGIFWLNGLAGTGKSTIARTIARKYYEQKRLGASFFFSRGGGDVGHAGMFVTTIAHQLADNVPPLRQYISQAIEDCSGIVSHALGDQWRRLILGPLSQLDGDSQYILVIDALDECDSDKNIQTILRLLAKDRTVRLRVFLTSRPETPIRYSFREIPQAEHQDFILHDISPKTVGHDISIFLEHNFKIIRDERELGTSWPSQRKIDRLVQNAGGLFIWAATACMFIRKGFVVEEKLDMLLEGDNSTNTPENHLSKIYITVLKNSSRDYTEQDKQSLYRMLRVILGSIVILFEPVSAGSLSKLLSITRHMVNQALKDLHAILAIPTDQARPLRLHHPSFRDFLLDKDRCGDSNFWVDEKQAHLMLADRCIQLMSSLKQDICGLHDPGALLTTVKTSQVEQFLPPEVQYACRYWVSHLQRSSAHIFDNDKVHRFLREHLLHWLEALSWMQKIYEGIRAIISLESIASVSLLWPPARL
jgi:hypothetical protein